MSMSSIPADRRGEWRDEAQRGTFARRIECDGTRRDAQAAPARGGGLREADAWARRLHARP